MGWDWGLFSGDDGSLKSWTVLGLDKESLSSSFHSPSGWISVCEPPARGDFVSPLAAVAEVLSECRLLSYMSQMSMRMSFLFRLINIIHVQTLTQVKSCRSLAVALLGVE